MSPDPTGIFLGNLTDPQSLNLYAYVRNNSPSMTDSGGLQCDGFDSDCCDICIPIGIGIGIGGGGDSSRIGPQPPLHIPAGGISPNPSNGTSTSDDPFSGETNGIPNGLQIPTRDLAGMLGIEMPNPWIFSVNPNLQGPRQECLNKFYQSNAGKAIDALSIGGLLWGPNKLGNLELWAEAALGKYGILTASAAVAKKVGTETLTTLNTSTTLASSYGTGMMAGLKFANRVSTASMLVATAIDIAIHGGCGTAGDPNGLMAQLQAIQ
jgi:hypothetical protein